MVLSIYSVYSYSGPLDHFSLANCKEDNGCTHLERALTQGQTFLKSFNDDIVIDTQSFSFEENDSALDQEIRNKILVESVNSFKETDYDKKKHFTSGRAIGIMGEAICEQLNIKKLYLCRIGSASLAGILKEVYDSTGRGNVEVNDALATTAGTLYFEVKI